MCYETDDDELVDAVLLQQQIEVGIGEAAGTPMFLSDDIAGLRCEFAADLATPCAVFEGLARPAFLLDRRNVLPGLIIARAVAMMHRIENTYTCLSRSIQGLQHVRNAFVCFGDFFYARPYLAAF